MESMSTFVEGPGKPYNYHPTPAERAAAEADRKAAEEQEAKQKEAEEEAQRAEEERQAKEHEEENARRTAEAKEQERLLLEARSKPLRGYVSQVKRFICLSLDTASPNALSHTFTTPIVTLISTALLQVSHGQRCPASDAGPCRDLQGSATRSNRLPRRVPLSQRAGRGNGGQG